MIVKISNEELVGIMVDCLKKRGIRVIGGSAKFKIDGTGDDYYDEVTFEAEIENCIFDSPPIQETQYWDPSYSKHDDDDPR